jgi:hypothetical protein
MRLQILSTEHWSLLASRALAWNEAFSPAGMFLSTLTGAIVALALVAQASAFGEGFTLFALVILPIVLFIGVATSIRLGAPNYHESLCVIGMNRIRARLFGVGARRRAILRDERPRRPTRHRHHHGGAARRGQAVLGGAGDRGYADGGHDPELRARRGHRSGRGADTTHSS